MKPEEFEKCKEVSNYQEFMQTALGYDNLSVQDYQNFMPAIFEILPQRLEKDPVQMYEAVIEELRKRWTGSERLPFHGPWHHGLVAGIIIASLRNNGYNFSTGDIEEALRRGLMIPGGGCGFHGICGAASGVGIAMSIITRSTPFHNQERSKALQMNSEIIGRIARLGGPRCCTLSTYTTLAFAAKELKRMGYELPMSKVAGRCMQHALNEQCHGRGCPYFPRGDQ